MFIFAVEQIKEQWKKYLLLCLLAFCVLGVLLVVWHINGTRMPKNATCDEVGEYSLQVENQQEEVAFLSQFGLQVQSDSLVSDNVTIPGEFSAVYLDYNKLQQRIGLDLSDYKGVLAKRNIYKLENYESDGKEYFVTLLIYKNNVIGGHIGTKIYSEKYKPLA